MREPLDRERLENILELLGKSLDSKCRVYVTGGATALLYGWRDITIDLDFKVIPEPPKFYEIIAQVKNEGKVNLELATPDHFVPLLPGWETRSKYIDTYGKADFYHFDPYTQVLSKIERNHHRDQIDVENFIKSGLVTMDRLTDLFNEVKHECIKFPAIDLETLEERIKKLSGL